MIYPALTPLWYNLPKWYARSQGVKRFVNSIHRRGGKDVDDFSTTVQDALEFGGVHYYLFPTRVWAEEVIFKEQFTMNGVTKEFWKWAIPDGLNPIKKEKDSCIILPHNGARIQLGGTDDLSFVGKGGKSYTMSEFSLHKEEVTGFIAPILRQSDASFRANGTLRGKANQLYRMLKANENNPEWFTQWLRPQDTKCYCWVSDEYNINPELLAKIGDVGPNKGRIFNVQDDIDSGLISMTLARQEYLNEAESQVSGSYYAYEMNVARGEGRIGPIVATSNRVYTFWDLGGASESADTTEIIFAVKTKDDKFQIIDYYSKNGRKIDHYAQVLRQKGYEYAGHYAPHDAKKKLLFGDLISAADEVGIKFRRVPKADRVATEIEVCRRKWSDVSIHEPQCGQLVEHLEAYHEKSGKPCHDEHSHAADAFRTMCMAEHLGMVVDYLSPRRIRFDLSDKVGAPEAIVDMELEDFMDGMIF